MSKVLIVDDDPDILEFLGYNFRKDGYLVETAENGIEALKKVEIFRPDLILLDVMMPEMDGITTCRKIRENPENDDIIITFLSARGEDYSQINGLESGADDYIIKPVKPQVILSKAKSLLRRKKISNKENKRNESKIIIDEQKYTVIYQGKEHYLPRKEFELLKLLASNPNKVFKREEIYETIWGKNIFVSERTLDVHIRKIRQKLSNDIIITVKGIGYRFNSE